MLSHLIKKYQWLLLVATLSASISGACNVILIAQINSFITKKMPDNTMAGWEFIAVALIMMISMIFAFVLFEYLNHHAHSELQSFISKCVVKADYSSLEKVGGAKIQLALSEHSLKIAQFFVGIPTILMNLVIVIGCMVYMAILSFKLFIVAIILTALGSLGYHLAHIKAIHYIETAAQTQDNLFNHFQSLTQGAKELRLNWKKRDVFTKHMIESLIEVVRKQRTIGMSVFLVSTSWGNFLIYAFIGLVLFVLTKDIPDRKIVMTGFSLIFVFIVNPLQTLLMSIPRISMAKVSAMQVDELIDQLKSSESALLKEHKPILRSLELKAIKHRYYHEQQDSVFELGPINLLFQPGEITILVGGNGSGKTTLAKLIVGLYPPEEGEIILNGEPVNIANRDEYRQLFSAIFSDFHLFEHLLETDHLNLDVEGNQLLEKLHLNHKVKVCDGAFTTQTLSQGQRKRLALVAAYLENRPFMVFDEWAADQDPMFKDVFYRELLPELRAMGKAVLVISHDDRYFDCGDRVIRMENGSINS